MSDIDPKKMIYFASVVELGSISKAAAAMKISQPAMSTSMDRLEDELGFRLLDRSPRGIAPTQYGDILYCHARLIRDEIQLARAALVRAISGEQESIRIGALPSLAGSIIPTALGRWRERYPDNALQVVENAQIDLLTGLLRREFDFVVGFTEVFDMLDGLRQQVLFRDQLCVITRSTHPLVGQTGVSWGDLMTFPWVAPTSRRTHTVLEHVMSKLAVGPPQRITVCGSVSLLKTMVAETDYLALLPVHAVARELEEGRLCALPFEDPVLHRNIAVFLREGYAMDEPRRDLVTFIKDTGVEMARARSN